VSVSGRRTIFDERVFLAQSIPNVPGLLEATPMTSENSTLFVIGSQSGVGRHSDQRSAHKRLDRKAEAHIEDLTPAICALIRANSFLRRGAAKSTKARVFAAERRPSGYTIWTGTGRGSNGSKISLRRPRLSSRSI
jgi:hypothetical protein